MTTPKHRPDVLGLFAVGLWGLVVPLACLLAVGLMALQGSQAAALATEAARSVDELETARANLWTPTWGTPAPIVADLPATWAAGTELPTATPRATVTLTRVSPTSITSIATPTEPPRTETASAAYSATPVQEPSGTPAGELVIGYSVAGRPITVTQFGDGPVVRLIVAGIHGGNEWNTSALADELISHLRDQPERVPPEVTLYVLRALNPDGAARGTDIYARANDNNVDLNRNWPSRWQPNWSRNGCWRYLTLSGGSAAGSEPEVRALMAFMHAYAVDAVISYHSAALGIFAGGQPPDDASLSLAEAVAEVSDYPYPPLDFGCIYTGQLIDWASEQGIAALDIELTNHRDTDLEQNLRILDVFMNWHRQI